MSKYYILRQRLNSVIAKTLSVIVSSMLLLSCNQSTEVERFGSALLHPIISIDGSVKYPDGTEAFDLTNEIAVEECSFRLSSVSGQYSPTWQSISDYPPNEPLRPGVYKAEAFYGSVETEDFDKICLYGVESIDLASGEESSLPITCSVANAVVAIDNYSVTDPIISEFEAKIHTSRGGYISYPISEKRNVYLAPGDIDIHVALKMASGESTEFRAFSIPDAQAATMYRVEIETKEGSDGTKELIFSYDESTSNDDHVIRLTPEFLASKSPVVTPIGFVQEESVTVLEGCVPDTKLAFSVSEGELSELILNVNSKELQSKGWPQKVDLLSLSQATLDLMVSLGLKITKSDGRITEVDVTDVVSNMASNQEQSISLLAVGQHEKVSEVVVLSVNVEPVEITVDNISDMYMGENLAEVTLMTSTDLNADDIAVEMLADRYHHEWSAVEIVSIEQDAENNEIFKLALSIPNVKAGKVDLRILYLGSEKTRTELNVLPPKYSLAVDAFAKYAHVKIHCATPELQALITSMVNIYIDGVMTQQTVRHVDEGIIVVGGLNEKTTYQLTTSLYENPVEPNHFTLPIRIRTEICGQLPNSGFEEVETGLVYANLPAGGRYSQNIVDIYNQQNYVSYDLYMPKKWTTVNDKTFCKKASNHNTWYMQPSAYTITDVAEGAFAVTIQSTSWDLNGEQIPNYRQTGTPYVNYNKNIPNITHRAAGRLFLGEYKFNSESLTEVYTEGIAFTSRPTSLNGYYKYVPCVNDISDCGIVLVEVVGKVEGMDEIISRTLHELPAAVSYTAFSVPLAYEKFGIKATSIKVMFASSKNYGSIEEESASVVTFSDVVTSTSHGGELSIDGLTLSY